MVMSINKSVKKTVNKVLTNKYVLYIVAFLAATNILGYLSVQNFTSITFFILLAFLTQYFSKNMTVILLTAMIGTSLLFITHNFGITVKEGKKEGLGHKNKKEEKDDAATAAEAAKKDMVPEIQKGATTHESLQSLKEALGDKGIEGLNMDTDELVARQKELQKSMKNLGPMMDQAKGILDKFDPGTLEKMTNILSGFTSK